jgi:IucA / IucC family/Ferric iron reductase FhuF-like transporter
MKLLLAHTRDDAALSYLERYVNGGSPSGFTERFTTSPETSPHGSTQSFRLRTAKIDPSHILFDGGTSPLKLGAYDFLLHPDMASDYSWIASQTVLGYEVTPTSSARTVRTVAHQGCYVKLAYHGLIGRIPRHLTVQHATSALEVSGIIRSAIEQDQIDSRFKFFCDVFARVVARMDPSGSTSEWGFVLRDPEPYPPTNHSPSILLPAFSLFSRDRNAPSDPLLLDQLVEASGIDPWAYVVDGLIEPTIQCYFSILKTLGLQLEPHAQNILYELSARGAPTHVIARDAESIDKDLSLIAEMNLPTHIRTDQYKSLRRSDYNYQVMHSFMFDFKLGEYLLEPLSEWLATKTATSKSVIYDAIRGITKRCAKDLPLDFFPMDCWFSYEAVVHDRTKNRSYVRHSGTKFR